MIVLVYNKDIQTNNALNIKVNPKLNIKPIRYEIHGPSINNTNITQTITI